jgi:hypothetical protein
MQSKVLDHGRRRLRSFVGGGRLDSIERVEVGSTEPKIVPESAVPKWPACFLLARVTDSSRTRIVHAQMLSAESVGPDGEELKHIRGRLRDPVAED